MSRIGPDPRREVFLRLRVAAPLEVRFPWFVRGPGAEEEFVRSVAVLTAVATDPP